MRELAVAEWNYVYGGEDGPPVNPPGNPLPPVPRLGDPLKEAGSDLAMAGSTVAGIGVLSGNPGAEIAGATMVVAGGTVYGLGMVLNNPTVGNAAAVAAQETNDWVTHANWQEHEQSMIAWANQQGAQQEQQGSYGTGGNSAGYAAGTSGSGSSGPSPHAGTYGDTSSGSSCSCETGAPPGQYGLTICADDPPGGGDDIKEEV